MLPPWLAGVLTLVLGVTSALAAQASAKEAETSGEWVKVPASFLSSRLVRSPQAAATVYRVIIDVPPASSVGAARPRVGQSSGNEAVDGIAYDYVKATLRAKPTLIEQNRGRELRFPLQVTPAVLNVSHLHLPPELSGTPTQGSYATPRPAYPPSVRARLVSGTTQVRVLFPAGGGTPQQVTLVESSGDRDLDAHTVQWVLLTWRAAANAPRREFATTLVYRLR